MAKYFLLTLMFVCYTVEGSPYLTVDSGVYDRVTVKIGDQVPRQFCHQVVRQIEVGFVMISYTFSIHLCYYKLRSLRFMDTIIRMDFITKKVEIQLSK